MGEDLIFKALFIFARALASTIIENLIYSFRRYKPLKLVKQFRSLGIVSWLYYLSTSQFNFNFLFPLVQGKYVTCTRDGMVSFYELDQELVATHKIETKGKWLTDMSAMSNTQRLAFSTADRDVFIYDVGGGKFERKLHLIGFKNAIMCLDHWFNYENLNHSGLVCGDTDGGVVVFQFSQTLKTGLFPKKEISYKGVTDLRKLWFQQSENSELGYHCSYYANLHPDWVRQVRFLEMAQGVQCFISCSHTDKNSMHLRELSDQIDSGTCRYVKRLTSNRNMVFNSRKGFISFDYSREWNLIITGGLDGSVKFWNPHIQKPATTMQTHQTGVCHISIMQQSGQVITIGQDKSIHIVELRDMSVSQKITPRASARLVGTTVNCAYFNSVNRSLLVAAIGVGIFQSNLDEVPIMKHSTMTMARTHEGVVSETLYNELFNQVVTSGHDGYVIVWDMFNGQKIIQFKVENGVEITAMCFDESKRRLITGTRTGNINIWNFNNGALLHILPKTSDVEITSLNYIRERIISGGWIKRITVYHDPKENSEYKEWEPMHDEDILSMSIYSNKSLPAAIVASASYDGDIYLWSLETGSVLSKLNRIESFSTQTTKVSGIAKLIPVADRKSVRGSTKSVSKSPENRATKGNSEGLSERASSKISSNALNTLLVAGEDNSMGLSSRRLSSSSFRRSTLNHAQTLAAINTLTTPDSEDGSSTDHGAVKRPSTGPIPRKSNLGIDKPHVQPSTLGADECGVNRKIFFGNSSKTHAKGAEALDIKLKNLMNIDNSKYWEANTSIEKILFLNSRVHHPETASMLASGDLGWVFAWSVHRQGGLLGQFTATSNDNESVTSMVCSKNGDTLVTADSEGYIRAWSIDTYCIHSNVRRNRMRQRTGMMPKINITEDVVLSDKRNRQINNIPPDQIFQFHAHIAPITVLAYCDMMDVLFSSSADGAVRVWAMTGKYIGTFGQKRLWNLKQIIDDPRPPQAQNRLPPDIKRVASYETLRLFNHGIHSWKLAKNILNILTIKNRLKNLKSLFGGGAPEKFEKPTDDTKDAPESEDDISTSPTDKDTTEDKPSRKTFVKTTRNIMQINNMSRPDPSIEEKYESCIERLG